MRDDNEIGSVVGMPRDDYEAFRTLDRTNRKKSGFVLTSGGDLCVHSWRKDCGGGYIFQFSAQFLVSDFHNTEALRDLCEAYHATRKTLWKVLERLGVDPWGRVIDDYQRPMSLEVVAERHGLKQTTLSKGLKQRGVPRHRGRLPRQFDPKEVKKALRDNPSVNELHRRLGCSWKTADKEMKQARADEDGESE